MRRFILRSSSLAVLVLVVPSLLVAADHHPGWPLNVPSYGPPVVVDVNGDGEKEIIFSLATEIRVYSHDGVLLESWPNPWPSHPYLYLGDVLGSNPGPELLLEGAGVIKIWDLEGNSVSPTIDDGDFGFYLVNKATCLSDLDGDGDLEIVVSDGGGGGGGCFGCGMIRAFHGDGTMVEGYPIPLPVLELPWQGSIIFAPDLDLDGSAELAFSFRQPDPWGSQPFYVLRADGTILPGFPYIGLDDLQGAVSVENTAFADLDADGTAEIVGCGLPQSLVALELDRSYVWYPPTFVPGSSINEEPAIGNFDGDPELEIAVGGNLGITVQDSDATGQVIGVSDPAYSDVSTVTAADVDGDGIDEIIALTSWWNGGVHVYLHVLDPQTMTNLPGFPHDFGATPAASNDMAVTVEDLDLDGDFELICRVSSDWHVFTVPNPGTPATRASWPTLYGNYARNRDYHYQRGPYPHFLRGDAHPDGRLDLADVVSLAEVLFSDATTDCVLALDVNDDARQDVTDVIALVGHIFFDGSPLAAPYPECGAVERRTPECRDFSCP